MFRSIRTRIERRRYLSRQALLRDAFRPGGVQPSLRQMGVALDLVQAGTCEWQHVPGIGAILRGVVPPLTEEVAHRILHAMGEAARTQLDTLPTQQEPGLR